MHLKFPFLLQNHGDKNSYCNCNSHCSKERKTTKVPPNGKERGQRTKRQFFDTSSIIDLIGYNNNSPAVH